MQRSKLDHDQPNETKVIPTENSLPTDDLRGFKQKEVGGRLEDWQLKDLRKNGN